MKRIDLNNQILVSLEKVNKPINTSFNTGIYRNQFFDRSWHYHPEFELLLITKGSGKRMVGNHVENFYENDLVLLGGLLPHAWISDPKYFVDGCDELSESIYIQFQKSIFGSYFIDIPELNGVRKILKKAERGIKIRGKQKSAIISIIKNIPGLAPFEQLLELLKALNLIHLTDYQLLVSQNYLDESFYFKSDRMIKVYEFLMENFKSEISVKTCADMSNMTVPAFCRFFKNETHETFTNYLNKIRIDFSKKLLLNTNIAIKEICYECGYNSVPYFNKQFKKEMGTSPFKYRKFSGLIDEID